MVKSQKLHTLKRTGNKSDLRDPKTDKLPSWVLVVSITSALIFLVMLLIIAIFIPRPLPFQMLVFRVLLSLAGAAFGAGISGFGTIKIDLPLWGKGLVSASGALALFVLIYCVNPPHRIVQPVPSPVEKQSLSGVLLDQKGEPVPGVTVTILEFGLKDITNNQGAFSFVVEAEKNATVRLMAKKEGFATLRVDSVLGTKGHTFKMERRL